MTHWNNEQSPKRSRSTVMRNLFKNTQTLPFIFIFFWILKRCVSAAHFFPWPCERALKQPSIRELDLFDRVTNIGFIQNHDLTVNPSHADVCAPCSRQKYSPLEFAKFSLRLFIECCTHVPSLVSILAQSKNNFFWFLEAYFMFSFYFWMAH